MSSSSEPVSYTHLDVYKRQPLNSTILRAVEKIVGVRPLLVGPGIKTGINILMDNPKTLGSDLIVDVAAAIHEHPLPLVVIDMGTATTMSVADKQGNYIGGVILPGLRVSLNSLSGKTAQLPYISLEVPDLSLIHICPPESWAGYAFIRSSSPTSFNSSFALSLAFLLSI